MYNAPGILEFIGLIEDMHEGIFVHSIYLDENPKEDQNACFVRDLHCVATYENVHDSFDASVQWGNVNEQVANVSWQLSHIPELAGGFDAIGFSQGGSCAIPLVTFLTAHAS